MKFINVLAELYYFYFGLDMYELNSGDYFGVIKDIFIKQRNDESSQIYVIFEIYFPDYVQLNSQMFYMSRNQESIFFQFFHNIGMLRSDRAGYEFAELIGQTGILTVEDKPVGSKVYKNIVNFFPMSPEEWERERALAHVGKVEQ